MTKQVMWKLTGDKHSFRISSVISFIALLVFYFKEAFLIFCIKFHEKYGCLLFLPAWDGNLWLAVCLSLISVKRFRCHFVWNQQLPYRYWNFLCISFRSVVTEQFHRWTRGFSSDCPFVVGYTAAWERFKEKYSKMWHAQNLCVYVLEPGL